MGKLRYRSEILTCETPEDKRSRISLLKENLDSNKLTKIGKLSFNDKIRMIYTSNIVNNSIFCGIRTSRVWFNSVDSKIQGLHKAETGASRAVSFLFQPNSEHKNKAKTDWARYGRPILHRRTDLVTKICVRKTNKSTFSNYSVARNPTIGLVSMKSWTDACKNSIGSCCCLKGNEFEDYGTRNPKNSNADLMSLRINRITNLNKMTPLWSIFGYPASTRAIKTSKKSYSVSLLKGNLSITDGPTSTIRKVSDTLCNIKNDFSSQREIELRSMGSIKDDLTLANFRDSWRNEIGRSLTHNEDQNLDPETCDSLGDQGNTIIRITIDDSKDKLIGENPWGYLFNSIRKNILKMKNPFEVE